MVNVLHLAGEMRASHRPAETASSGIHLPLYVSPTVPQLSLGIRVERNET